MNSLRSLLLSVLPLVLGVSLFCSCQDPFGFGPHDPKKQNPPAAPVQIEPADDTMIPNYVYPQDVTMKWLAVSGAKYYQVEAYTDSLPLPEKQHASKDKVYSTETSIRFYRYGYYWWRVRAYSPNWKWYTDWSPLHRFLLPNPTGP